MDRRGPALLLLAALAAGCGGGISSSRSAAELTNPFLGPEHTSWLIGAVSYLASPEEVQQYLALRDDGQAAAFVEAFWSRRDPAPDRPGNPLRETLERRSADADRLYSESGILGRRTDRGTFFVLYGPPKKVEFELSPVPHGPPVEAWLYDSNSPAGLDGRRPSGIYRFIKSGDLTVLYRGTTPSRPVGPYPSNVP
jgi:GWxTD domain-containing protein